MSVNRTELIAAIAAKTSLKKTEADAFLAAFQDVLVESVSKGEAVKITGLMGVERVKRAARTGRNPRTGEEIQIPAGYGVKLTVGSALKKAVADNCARPRAEGAAAPLDRPHAPGVRYRDGGAPLLVAPGEEALAVSSGRTRNGDPPPL